MYYNFTSHSKNYVVISNFLSQGGKNEKSIAFNISMCDVTNDKYNNDRSSDIRRMWRKYKMVL